MEHLHFMLKTVLESLLGHIMQRSAQRVAGSLGTIDRVMDGIQKEMGLKKELGHHKIKDPEQAVKVIATTLILVPPSIVVYQLILMVGLSIN